MRRFVLFCMALFCNFSMADTLDLNWLVDGETYAQTSCEYGEDLILPEAPVKKGYQFVGWEVIRYKEVEYLESTGSQYIDTGVNFLFGDEFFIDYMHTGILTGENKGYGSGGPVSGSSKNTVITGAGREVSSKQQMWIIDSNYAYSPSISLNKLINVRTTEQWKIDTSTRRLTSVLTNVSTGAAYTLTSNPISTSYNSNGSVFLYRDNYSPWANPSQMRIYRTWLKRKDGTLVFDLIPVVDVAGVPCFYDQVSDTLLYNGGTEDFGIGPEL